MHAGGGEGLDVGLDDDTSASDAVAQVVVDHGVLCLGRVAGPEAVQVVVQAAVEGEGEHGVDEDLRRVLEEGQLVAPAVDDVDGHAARVAHPVDDPRATPRAQVHLSAGRKV